jgi:RNA polymerase sigma-54 factor
MVSRVRTNLSLRQRMHLTQGLSASIRVLSMDASGLSRYLAEQAADNPHLRLEEAPLPAPLSLPRWTGVLLPHGDGAEPGRLSAGAPSLLAHVEAGIARLIPPGRARRLALALSAALEPSGWLARPLAALAAETGASVPELESVLVQLRGLDPPGLFARSLQDCLTLQAVEAGWFDPVAQVCLANLPLVAAGEVDRLARLARADPAAVRACLRRIRTLNPKPGAVFDPGAPPAPTPDLLARLHGGVWLVEPNPAAHPALRLDRTPARGADAGRLAEARALVRQVEARGRTLLRVGQEIARRQAAALHDGPAALVPMSMEDIAEPLGLHPTTVGRAVAGVSMDTPRGPVWLRRFFSAAVGEGGQAAAAVKARLAALVAAEDPRAPLSDLALAGQLAAAGLGTAARRTVAKYRAALGLPPAHLRRRAGGG